MKFGLPMPDQVIFLDMDPEIAARLIAQRARAEQKEEDIHELDTDYQRKVHDAYADFAQRYGWARVACSENGLPRDVDAIHADVVEIARQSLKR